MVQLNEQLSYTSISPGIRRSALGSMGLGVNFEDNDQEMQSDDNGAEESKGQSGDDQDHTVLSVVAESKHESDPGDHSESQGQMTQVERDASEK